MKNYDFSRLDPHTFECLARDLVQRKISEELQQAFHFTSFSQGPDGGMDAFYRDKQTTIILQAKRYTDFSTLYSKLRSSDLSRMKQHQPDRYILVTSVDLTQRHVEKLLELFQPWIRQSNDIIGAATLNNLLGCYPAVELNYPQLYLYSSAVLEKMLHAAVYNQSSAKLRLFQKQLKTYVPGEQLSQSMMLLRKHRYVMISGDPGAGKSALAGILSLYYVNKGYEFVFIRRQIDEAWALLNDVPDRKRVFLFDDFVGSTAFEGFDRNEDRALLDFVKEITQQRQAVLIITTRSYILEQAEKHYPELKNIGFSQCSVEQHTFTEEFKTRLLYKYLYYYPVEWHHIKSLKWDNRLQRLINHRHFSPRIVSEYLEKYYDPRGHKDIYTGLKTYFDDPYEFWEGVFKKLTPGAQLLLLVLAITEEPAVEEILLHTFCAVAKYRKVAERGYETDCFTESLRELSETFIVLSANPDPEESGRSFDLIWKMSPFANSRYIEFQNPSIKDYTVRYLGTRPDLISCLLKSAVTFNQLFFIFTTQEDDQYIDDEEALVPHGAGKIVLNDWLQQELINRLKDDLEKLSIAGVERVHWTHKKTTFHYDLERHNDRMEPLRWLLILFPGDDTILQLVYDRYSELIKPTVEEPLAVDERVSQADVIRLLHPYFSFDPEKTLREFDDAIRFSHEFLSLDDLGRLFPEAYKKWKTADPPALKKRIMAMIAADIDYYLYDAGIFRYADKAMDNLFDYVIDSLQEVFEFRLTAAFKRSVNNNAGEEMFILSKRRKAEAELTDEEEAPEVVSTAGWASEDTLAITLLDQLTPDRSSFYDFQHAKQLIREAFGETAAAAFDKLPRRCKSELNSPEKLTLWARNNCPIPSADLSHSASETALFGLDALPPDLQNDVQSMAFHLYRKEYYPFWRRESLRALLSDSPLADRIETLLDTLLERGLIVCEGPWLRFPDNELHILFVARYLSFLPVEERSTLYASFHEAYDREWDITFFDLLWRYCLQIDHTVFVRSLVHPVLLEEQSFLQTATLPEIVAREGTLDFCMDEEIGEYMLHGGTVHYAVLQDVLELIDAAVLIDRLEDCVNISLTSDPATQTYIRSVCMQNEKEYAVDFPKLVQDTAFQPMLVSSGMEEVVRHYKEQIERVVERYGGM